MDCVKRLCESESGTSEPEANEDEALGWYSLEGSLNPRVLKHGWLRMQKKFTKKWSDRYFVLRKDGLLLCYNSKRPSEKPRHKLGIDSVVRQTEHEHELEFLIAGRKFRANSTMDQMSWQKAFDSVSRSLSSSSSSSPASSKKEDGLSLEKLFEKSGGSDSILIPHKLNMSDFNFLKIIGKGTYGKVFLCQEELTGELYAVKAQKRGPTNLRKNRLDSELRILQSLEHPFIVRFKGSFQNDKFVFYLMEYANGGDMRFHISRCGSFSESRTKFYATELTLALGYLHKHEIIYRDFKLSNILLDNEGHIRLADFGVSRDNFTTESRTTSFVGTVQYLAPEVIEAYGGTNSYGYAADWWSLGVILYKFMCGIFPFYNNNNTILYNEILNSPVKLPSQVSESARKLLSDLMIKDPTRRLGSGIDGVENVKNHEFFSNVDWVEVYDKRTVPPFVPKKYGEIDTRYFNKKITKMNVEEALEISDFE